MYESGTDVTECRKKVANGGKIVGGTRSSVNARGLQLECTRMLHKAMFLPVLLYASETMIWREKEISRILAVQMDNVRGLLGIRRINRVPNARIRELCGVAKRVDEKMVRPYQKNRE